MRARSASAFSASAASSRSTQVELSPELAASLAASEIERAAAVRARRFAALPASAAERAAQSRFLLGRGFSPDLVQRLMRRLARADVAASEGALGAD